MLTLNKFRQTAACYGITRQDVYASADLLRNLCYAADFDPAVINAIEAAVAALPTATLTSEPIQYESEVIPMPYYNTCTRCGANLDPGEKCDCDWYPAETLPELLGSIHTLPEHNAPAATKTGGQHESKT